MKIKSIYGFINAREKIMKGTFAICAVFSVFALSVITVFLFMNGIPFISEYGFGEFIFGTEWTPTADNPSFGIFNMIVGSVYVTALSVAFGVGIGLFCAICLYKFCPKKLVAVIRQMINLLAGIPSVIFGLFGVTVIVPFVRDYLSPNGVGYGILSASIVLGIMVLPTIVSVSLDAMNAVSESYYEGALALGATKEQATFKVMIPAAKSGVLAGVVLAIGRAIGETMAVIMVMGNSPELPESLFQSVRSLTANIALGAMELKDDALSALIATGVVLFVFTLLLNLSFSLLKRDKADKRGKPKGRKAVINAFAKRHNDSYVRLCDRSADGALALAQDGTAFCDRSVAAVDGNTVCGGSSVKDAADVSEVTNEEN